MKSVRIWLENIRTIFSTYLCRTPARNRIVEKFPQDNILTDLELVLQNNSFRISSIFLAYYESQQDNLENRTHLAICNLHWYISRTIDNFDLLLAKLDTSYTIQDTHIISTPGCIEQKLKQLLKHKTAESTLLCYIDTEILAVEILQNIANIIKYLKSLIFRLDVILDTMLRECEEKFPAFRKTFINMKCRKLSLEGKPSLENFVQEFRLVTYEPELDEYIIKLSCFYETVKNLELAQRFIY